MCIRDRHKSDIVAFLRVYLRSVDMMKKTPAEDLADDYMRFYNCLLYTSRCV